MTNSKNIGTVTALLMAINSAAYILRDNQCKVIYMTGCLFVNM